MAKCVAAYCQLLFLYELAADLCFVDFRIYIDYILLRKIHRKVWGGESRTSKYVLVTSLLINFSILFLFKYYNFFNDIVFTLLSATGVRWAMPDFDILLPVGISFYTFQAVGYSIDVYRGTIKAENNFFTYALFVSFFPQLVAGPIERAKNLLTQFHVWHQFDYQKAVSGCKMMLWGYFMKLCVADRLAAYVDAVYNNVPQHTGTSMIVATFFFAFQIYCDFGGYSLIAIGAAKVMGFSLMENFRRPYFALSLKEFWKRWHISLSTWFMDYVYIPLGGNRVPYPRHLANLFITFLVSGIWHGANWTFVAWGALHGFYIVVENVYHRIFGKSVSRGLLLRLIKLLFCFALVCFAWIFFRANNISDAFDIIRKIFTNHGSIFSSPLIMLFGGLSLLILLVKDAIDEWYPMKIRSSVVNYLAYLFLTVYILMFGVLSSEGQFIYFQF